MNTKQLIQHFLLLIKKNQIPLYRDRLGRPFIELPLDPKKRSWPLRSQTVRSWISTECFDSSIVPSSREIEAVLNVLEGKAWKNIRSGIADADLALLVEQDSLIQAVLEFMNSRVQHVTMMSQLMKELKGVAETCGLLKISKRKWPEASWIFGQRLREAQAILNRLGISLKFRHTKHGTEVTLENLDPKKSSDASSVTESSSASPPNPKSQEDLGASDASITDVDDLTAAEQASIAELNQRMAARRAGSTVNTPENKGKEVSHEYRRY